MLCNLRSGWKINGNASFVLDKEVVMLRKGGFSGLIVFIAVVAAALYSCGGGSGSKGPSRSDQLVSAINAHRELLLLPPLEIDPALQTAAQRYATHVAAYAPYYSRDCTCG
jgi:hypothetical protein